MGRLRLKTSLGPFLDGLLAVLAKPDDGADTGAYARSDKQARTSADNGTGYSSSAGGGAQRGEMAGGVVVADDRAFTVDAGVAAGVEVDQLRVKAIERAVGEGDGFRHEMDGGRRAEAVASADFGDAAFDRGSDRKDHAAVMLDVMRERGDEVRALLGVRSRQLTDQMGAEDGALGEGIFVVRGGGDNAGVKVIVGSADSGLVGLVDLSAVWRWTGAGCSTMRDWSSGAGAGGGA